MLQVSETVGLALSRRDVLRNGMVLQTCSTIFQPNEAMAAKGAAELDFEYYMRDLIGGNKKEGNVVPSAPPTLTPPRELQGPLISLLLNNECSVECTTIAALVERVAISTGVDPKNAEQTIQRRVSDYRERAGKSFYFREPWNAKQISDQYYFDLTAYAVWRTAADSLPNYIDRDLFVRQLGRLNYEKLLSAGILKQSPPKKGSLVESIPCMEEMLDLFTASQFCKGYRLGERLQKGEDPRPVFDDIDDEALSAGAGVDCLVSIFEPATLGASLQITGEQSRFSPDYIGPVLSAIWEKAGIKSTSEFYFVDPTYRPNPKGMDL